MRDNGISITPKIYPTNNPMLRNECLQLST